MGRRPCCAKEGLNRGAWSAREDDILTNYINTHGKGKWRDLPQRAGLKRCGKSCRLRWLNYLRPGIKRGNISVEEDELIIRLHKLLGNRWSLIAGRLPGRTDNEIKNYWNTNLSKRVQDDKVADIYSTNKQKSLEDQMCPRSGKVIRTKAFRCTKVVFPSLQDNHKKLSLIPNTMCDCENPMSYSSAQPDDQLDINNSPDFLLDFDIDDLLLSDVLNSSEFQEPNLEINFEKIYTEDAVDGDDHNDHQNDAKLDNFTINEETRYGQENWQDTESFQLQDNEGLDQLNVLSSFLNSEDDQWIRLNNKQ